MATGIIDLKESTAKQSSTSRDPASYAFEPRKHSRTNRKAIGEWWEVQF